MLVIQKSFLIAQWTDALKGVRKWLMPPLADFLVDEERSLSERGLIASIYGTYAIDLPDGYALLEKRLAEQDKPDALVEARIVLAKQRASAATATIRSL
jgi:hypothetical protein